ncbi:MAG: hypothetical protein ACI9FG_000155 [Crocinitomicaceae bacterium]|jgi:hypothetical protein
MSDPDILTRFEELEAGRIIGDLDTEETMEWQELSKDPRCKPDISLEFMAAAIETEYLQQQAVDLPANMVENIKKNMEAFTSGDSSTVSDTASSIHPVRWQTLLLSPQAAWALAALFLILFINQSLVTPLVTDPPSNQTVSAPPQLAPNKALAKMRTQASDLVVSDFGGIQGYDKMSGQVIWSDTLQEGYMTLTNLPANNPTAKQYQLWIVDPSRDEKPVDGGVFDIPSGEGTVIIPIRNPLVVTNPKAFVITLEQPGGVVVSKQEIVVALAKPS